MFLFWKPMIYWYRQLQNACSILHSKVHHYHHFISSTGGFHLTKFLPWWMLQENQMNILGSIFRKRPYMYVVCLLLLFWYAYFSTASKGKGYNQIPLTRTYIKTFNIPVGLFIVSSTYLNFLTGLVEKLLKLSNLYSHSKSKPHKVLEARRRYFSL